MIFERDGIRFLMLGAGGGWSIVIVIVVIRVKKAGGGKGARERERGGRRGRMLFPRGTGIVMGKSILQGFGMMLFMDVAIVVNGVLAWKVNKG